MGDNAGRLDVLSRQGRHSTALARQGGLPTSILNLDEALAAAAALAKSGLVGRDLANPAAVVRVGMKGQAMGIDFFEAVDVIDVIDKKPVPNAQCRLGHIRRRGHEAEFVFEECNGEQAVIRGRRREHRNDPKGWRTVTYSLADAEEAGLLDEWVERKFRRQGDQYDRTEKFMLRRTESGYVPAQLGAETPEWAAAAIKAGQVKRKDNWWKNRKAMLRARAASTLYRMHFSDLMFSADAGPYTAEELGHDQGSDVDDYPDPGDDEVYDAEIVYQGEDIDMGQATAAPPGPVPDDEQPEVYDRRRARANAVMGEVGIKGDARHAAVREATGGATESTGRLTAWQVDAIVAYCDRRKAVAQEPEPEGGRDNAGAEIVEPAAPAPSGPVGWRAKAKAAGMTDGQVLIKMRELAGQLGQPPPGSLAEVDEQTADFFSDWIAE